MSIKTVLVAMLALVFGGSAALVVVFFSPKSKSQAKTETEGVVVASIDIGRGVTVTSEMVEMKEWPKTMIPVGATRKIEDAVGQTTRTAIVKEEAVLRSKLTDGTGLHALVPPGMRAYTIQTPTQSAGVGGFIRPEDRVDVILTVTSAMSGDEQRTGGGIATVLLQNVQVLAAGPSLDANPEVTKVEGRPLTSVTLLVTSRQAQELTLAQTKGTLNLALRHDGDATDDSPPPLYLSDLPFLREDPNAGEAKEEEPVVEPTPPPPPVAVVPAAPPTPRKPPSSQIRTYRGLSAGVVVVEGPRESP